MNILVIAPYGMYDNISGSFVHNQVKEFAKMGNNVSVIIPIAFGKRLNSLNKINFGVSYTKKDGVELYYVKYFSLSKFGANGFNLFSTQLSFKIFLSGILRGKFPEIVHAHTIGFGGTLGKKIKENNKIPLVITTHGSDTEAVVNSKRKAKILSVCNSANLIVAVSEKLKKKLEQLELQTPIECIKNGFVKENIIFGEKDPYLITQVGHLIPSKHFEDTIKAVAILQEKDIVVNLNVIGKGYLIGKLKALCKELNVEKQVRFLGEIDNKQVFEKLARSQFFVLPSFPEGFGIVYLEAMASGCITIGTRGEGIAEVIASGENGYLVNRSAPEEIADCIQYCIDNSEEAIKISEKGKESVSRLSWEENAKSYIKKYKELILRN